MDILPYIKQHPKEVAGLAGASAILGIAVVSRLRKTASTPAAPDNTIGNDLPTAYVINTGGVPINTDNLSSYVAQPGTQVTDGQGTPTQNYTSGISSVLGLPSNSGSLVDQNAISIPAPANITSTRSCPSGYHFYPQLGKGGTSINWVCKASHGQSPEFLATTAK